MNQSNKILLISGSGFLGSTLFKTLPEMGFSVSATNRTTQDKAIILDLEKPIEPQLKNDLQQKKLFARTDLRSDDERWGMF